MNSAAVALCSISKGLTVEEVIDRFKEHGLAIVAALDQMHWLSGQDVAGSACHVAFLCDGIIGITQEAYSPKLRGSRAGRIRGGSRTLTP
jgi:hypothetical protein